MARTPLVISTSTPAGREAVHTPVAPEDGAVFVGHNGRQRFLLRNPGGAPATATIVTGATVGGLDVEDRVITVPPGLSFVAGPYPADLYNQIGTNELHINVSGALEIAVLD